MRLLAIDPGCHESAFVVYDGGKVIDRMKYGNGAVCEMIQNSDPNRSCIAPEIKADFMVIESVASYGMAVGAEVFETCVWSGRFIQAWHSHHPGKWGRLYRKDIKLHLCGSARAKDANVRQALIDRFGGSAAIGKKKTPGPLYGITRDCWAALAVAVVWADRHCGPETEGA